MKNKSHLALMEQLLMVLVFSLAAALCLQGFVLANRISSRMETRNQAVTLAQNAAEAVKYHSGDLEQAVEQLAYEWNGQDSLRLEITPTDSETPFLGTARIRVFQDAEVIFEITAAWQEENANAEK